MNKFTSLKEQYKKSRIIQEAISDVDLDKLDDTFEQLDSLLGDSNIPSIQNAIEQARKQIVKVAGKPGSTLSSAIVGNTIAELVLLQSMLVSTFQSIPKIFRIVKSNLPKIITNNKVQENSISRLRSVGRLILEKEFNPEELGASQDNKDLKLDISNQDKKENNNGNVIYTTMLKRLYKQAKQLQSNGENFSFELPDSLKAFSQNVVLPAIKELDMKPIEGSGARGKFTNSQVDTLIDKMFQTKRGSTKGRKTSRPGISRQDMSKIPIWSLLRQQGQNGQEAIQNAQKLISQSFRPKGFLNKLKSALKGGKLPFEINANQVAKEILSLPLQNFLQLMDRSKQMTQMELPIEKAEEVANIVEKIKNGKSIDVDKTKIGRKISLEKLQTSLQRSKLPRQNQDTLIKFFKNNLVGKGPVEFIE